MISAIITILVTTHLINSVLHTKIGPACQEPPLASYTSIYLVI